MQEGVKDRWCSKAKKDTDEGRQTGLKQVTTVSNRVLRFKEGLSEDIQYNGRCGRA